MNRNLNTNGLKILRYSFEITNSEELRPVTDIEKLDTFVKVYNFTVANDHNYYVSRTSFRAHNRPHRKGSKLPGYKVPDYGPINKNKRLVKNELEKIKKGMGKKRTDRDGNIKVYEDRNKNNDVEWAGSIEYDVRGQNSYHLRILMLEGKDGAVKYGATYDHYKTYIISIE